MVLVGCHAVGVGVLPVGSRAASVQSDCHSVARWPFRLGIAAHQRGAGQILLGDPLCHGILTANSQEHAFAIAVEDLLNIEAPVRAQYIRVMFAEVTRILNHLLNIPAFAMDIGAATPMLWAFEEREKMLEFHEAVSGARFHAAYFRPGGVHQDLPDNLLEKMKTYFTNFPKFIDTIEELLTENRIFKQRSVDIGILSRDDAIKLSCSGPVLRASGVAWDLFFVNLI